MLAQVPEAAAPGGSENERENVSYLDAIFPDYARRVTSICRKGFD